MSRSNDALGRYRTKRDFGKTSEPSGRAPGRATGSSLYVVQKHDARRLHYDLRLELDGVLKSWAVPQGPSLDPSIRRLAVETEDHPIAYGDFEGRIPAGQYGAGSVIIWDRGSWQPIGDAHRGYREGKLKFRLDGMKLRGGWTLVRMKDQKNWLLIKERDEVARPETEYAIVEEQPASIVSERTSENLAGINRPSVRAGRSPSVARLSDARRAPLPRDQKVQLGTLVEAPPPASEGWLHEIKYDGYRTLSFIDNDAVQLRSRSDLEWTDRFGPVAQALAALPCKEALIDGELVVQDNAGVTHIGLLQDALASGAAHRILLYAFDLLYLDGYDLRQTPLHQRKRALRQLIGPVVSEKSQIQISDELTGDPADVLQQACRLGLEGIISKRRDAKYRAGRSKAWLKLKCVGSDEFHVIGFRMGKDATALNLLLAEKAGKELRFAGTAGTGFSAAEAKRLHQQLLPLARKRPVVTPPADLPKPVTWVEPKLIIEATYGGRTKSGQLRGVAFRRLVSKSTAKPVAPDSERPLDETALSNIDITHADRVMFGHGGPTKLDIAVYYARMAARILPEVARRPVSFVRCPSGQTSSCFYQRHAMPGMPKSVKRIVLRETADEPSPKEYLYIEDVEGLLSLVQFGTVELHPWGCRIDKPDRPDRMIFDLDPDETLEWRIVVDAAFHVREQVESLGFVPFLKTTGGKGLHLVVPLKRRDDWGAVKGFSRALAENLARAEPRRFTATASKQRRRGRIYIDYLRNGWSATAIAAYSLRARPGVTAAVPLFWDELRELDDPRTLDWTAVPDRLNRMADPWEAMNRSARFITAKAKATVGFRN